MTDSPVKTHGCRLKELPTGGPHRAREGAVFWPYNWRSKLCTCVSCKVGLKKKKHDSSPCVHGVHVCDHLRENI